MVLKFWKSTHNRKHPGQAANADEDEQQQPPHTPPSGGGAAAWQQTRSPGRIGALSEEQCSALLQLRNSFFSDAAELTAVTTVTYVPPGTLAAYGEEDAAAFMIRGQPASEVDAILLRFLKARGFDVARASAMLRQFLAWRVTEKVPAIVETVRFPWVHTVRELYPHNYFGVDRSGRPIFIDCVGRSNPDRLLKTVKLDQLLAYWVQQYEYLRCVVLPACSFQAGRRIDQGVTVVDLSGLRVAHFNSTSRGILRRLAAITQDYYPEMLGAMVVVNAPAVFGPIWAFAKGLLDEHTVSKISLFTSRSNSWREALQKLAAPDQLPLFLGGTQPADGWQLRNFGPWSDPEIQAKVRQRSPSLPADFVAGTW